MEVTTTDALDLVGLEVGLEIALEELKETFDGDPQVEPLVEEVCSTVERVTMRVINGPEQVVVNVRELAEARKILQEIGPLAKEANQQLEAYLRVWLKR